MQHGAIGLSWSREEKRPCPRKSDPRQEICSCAKHAEEHADSLEAAGSAADPRRVPGQGAYQLPCKMSWCLARFPAKPKGEVVK